jgi:hypothetical protein
MIQSLQKAIYIRKIKTALKQATGIDSSILWSDLLSGHASIECAIADKQTPEETILKHRGNRFKHYVSLNDYQSAKSSWMICLPLMSAHKWYQISDKWREEGLVSKSIYKKFRTRLEKVEEKWPDMFTENYSQL